MFFVTIKIMYTKTTDYWPQANGKFESFNRTLVAMFRRVVQRRPFNWKPLRAPVLQTYQSTISESSGDITYILAVGCEMLLPIDFGARLPKPPKDIQTLAIKIAKQSKVVLSTRKNITGFNHCRAENRYNKRTVQNTFLPKTLMRLLQRSHLPGVQIETIFKIFRFVQIYKNLRTGVDAQKNRFLESFHGDP